MGGLIIESSFRGAQSANPESRDSGSGPSDHPGMTLQYQRIPQNHVSLTLPRRVEPPRARALPTIGPDADGLEHIMKITLLVLLGLVVGALGGAALGIGAGLGWVQFFRTTGFEDYTACWCTLPSCRSAPRSADWAARSCSG